jgi:hypothetical protein
VIPSHCPGEIKNVVATIGIMNLLSIRQDQTFARGDTPNNGDIMFCVQCVCVCVCIWREAVITVSVSYYCTYVDQLFSHPRTSLSIGSSCHLILPSPRQSVPVIPAASASALAKPKRLQQQNTWLERKRTKQRFRYNNNNNNNNNNNDNNNNIIVIIITYHRTRRLVVAIRFPLATAVKSI